jgi:hypothetical protein
MKERTSPRVGRSFVKIAAEYLNRTAQFGAVAAALTTGVSCSDAGSVDEDLAEPVDSATEAFDPSPDPAAAKGHALITMKALKLLEARGMLPDPLKSAANQALIVYGNNFGDRTSSGWPNGSKPTQPITNRMSASVKRPSATALAAANLTGPLLGAFGQCPVSPYLTYKQSCDSFQFDAKLTTFPYDDPTVTVGGKATIAWIPGKVDPTGDPNGDFLSDSMRLLGTIVVDADVILDGAVSALSCLGEAIGQSECQWVEPAPTVQPVGFAVDNMYHYGYGDLRDIGVPFNETDTALRFYPFFKEHVPGWDGGETAADIAVKLSDAMRGQTLLGGADYGAQKYGSILYQVARRFFARSPQPEPDLAQLIKVGNDVPGWHTGWMQGHGGFSDLALDFPHTYLGGMPYVCSRSSGSADPCAAGMPTWPPWIKAAPPQTEWDLQALEQARPGRADRAGLIYLGWAVHMMQDSALPHHVAGWTGKEHQAQDEYGDRLWYYYDYSQVKVPKTTCIIPPSKLGPGYGCTTTMVPHAYAGLSNYLVDKALAPDLDALLGPAGATKKRNDICRSLGVTSGDGSATDLNWRAVYPLYLENSRKAYESRQERLSVADSYAAGLSYVKNAVLGSIKLMLCSLPEEENLALNRPSYQSSTVPGYDAGPSRANDGNRSGNFWDNSVSHTDAGFTWGVSEAPGQWWYVDLGAERVVNSVRIWNRTDCCWDRLSHYKILAWDSQAVTWKVIADQSATVTNENPFLNHPINNVKARWVMVAKTDDNYLQLGEVEVIGS